MQPWQSLWPDEHSNTLNRLLGDGMSYADIASYLNRQYHTTYTRCACIGRARRMASNQSPRPRIILEGSKETRTREAYQRANTRRREKRWAANPSLIQRAQRIKEAKETRAKMLANSTPKTAAAYRKHMPKQREMTRTELRAMLTQAVQNTAAMETA